MAVRERAIPFGITSKGPELNFQVVGGLPAYPDGVVPVEKTIATGLTASVYNYIEYWLAGRGWLYGNTSVMDLSNCNSVHITGSTVVSMAWSHAYGLKSNSRAELLLSDNTAIELASGYGELYTAGSTYTYTVDATVDLSGYSAEQLSSVSVRVGLGDISAGGGATSGLRHDANLTINSVTGISVSAEPGPPAENPIENTIWVNTDIDITEWAVSNMDPRSNLYTLDGAINGALINSSGAVDTSFTNFYATDYIAIPEGCTSLSLTQYYTTTGGYNAWYTADKTFISAFQKQSGTTELTVPTNAAYIRLSQAKISEPNGLVLLAAPKEGTVWIGTGNSSFVEFNALKENKLMILPTMIKQGNGLKWVFKDGHIYQNGEWITFFAPRDEGCWTFKKYASGASTPHPSDFVGKTVTATKIFKDSDLSTSMAIGDSYSAMCTTYLYFDADATLSISFTTDDGGSVTLNGWLLGDLTSCTAKTLSCPFKAGWNELVVCFTEGSGGDGWTTSPRLYNHASVKAMYASLY